MEPKNLHSDKFSGDAGERVLGTTGLEADASLCTASYAEPGLSWMPGCNC